MAASQKGHVDVVNKLLQQGATVDLLEQVNKTFTDSHTHL